MRKLGFYNSQIQLPHRVKVTQAWPYSLAKESVGFSTLQLRSSVIVEDSRANKHWNHMSPSPHRDSEVQCNSGILGKLFSNCGVHSLEPWSKRVYETAGQTGHILPECLFYSVLATVAQFSYTKTMRNILQTEKIK